MKRIIITSIAIAATLVVNAQDSYDAARFATPDLNGTARYVGMGGALAALGGDITTMGSNPASTGLFRKSEATITLSGVFGDDGVLGHDGSRASFDNAGVVIAMDVDEGSLNFVNFGINYTKNKNFLSNVNTPIEGLDGIYSQTFQMANLANQSYNNGYWGTLADMAAPKYNEDRTLNKNGLIYDMYDNNSGEFIGYYGCGANQANYQRSSYGATSQIDANLSFNIKDQYFFGLGIGFYDIDYNRQSFYEELGTDGYYYDFSNWYSTKGDGVDVKLGFVCRPIQDSPFRFGLAVHTPTWYRMEDVSGGTLYGNDVYITDALSDPYEYNYRTPWKFDVSLGYTVGNYFAVGAEYQYQDLSSAHYSEDGYQTDYFMTQNQFIKDNLQGQSTFKLGFEVKPIDAFSIRAGYNYVSAPFKDDAYRIIAYDSPFTETDFTNWKATNRFTFGLGYRYKGGYLDVAYQYSAQKGDFYAFDEVNLKPTSIENNRSQLMCTLGFRF